MRYLFAFLLFLLPALAGADDSFVALVAQLEAKNAAKHKPACSCGAGCPCTAGQCGDAACPTHVTIPPKPGVDMPGNPWQWQPAQGKEPGYWWRWQQQPVSYAPQFLAPPGVGGAMFFRGRGRGG